MLRTMAAKSPALVEARLQKLKEQIELRKQQRQQFGSSQQDQLRQTDTVKAETQEGRNEEHQKVQQWPGASPQSKTPFKKSKNKKQEQQLSGKEVFSETETPSKKLKKKAVDQTLESEKHTPSRGQKRKAAPDSGEEVLETSPSTNKKNQHRIVKADKAGKDSGVDEGHKDTVAGYTILGNFVNEHQNVPVKHKLPGWLDNPVLIKDKRLSVAADEKEKVEDDSAAMKLLCPDLREKLKKNGICQLFPVQREFFPVIWEDLKFGILSGTCGYRPRDICVSTPTGSGKTLAFVLPIVQALKDMMVPYIYAIVMLPVRDLAEQVYTVFCKYCAGTNLKVGLVVGKTTFPKEQETLVQSRYPGQYHSMVHILVATPGRLVDHIRQTPGFDLSSLRFLVIDEADKMMEMKNDWMSVVENAAYTSCPQAYFSMPRQRPGLLTLASAQLTSMPLQKMLFSATLSYNPEKLEQLHLFMPRLMTSGMVSGSSETVSSVPVQQEGGDEDVQESSIGKYTTPKGLKELLVATTPAEKPLVLLHLLHHRNFKQVLCFTNSIETTHRLFKLVQLYGGLEVAELSSHLHPDKRKKRLKKFADGKIQVLVCSDSMARGMDLPNVECVISYENPRDTSTYIHRVGRTARAGKCGTAYTLLENKEFFHFKSKMRMTGKWSNIREEVIDSEQLEPLVKRYTSVVLPNLKESLQNETRKIRR